MTNTGNIESEFKIFSSSGLRGWNVILGYRGGDCVNNGDHLLCTIEQGETVLITAKVNPPGGDNAEIEDTFKFVISAEPTDVGLVGRENIELTVNGQPAEFALNSLVTPEVLSVMAGIVLLGFAVLLLRRRK